MKIRDAFSLRPPAVRLALCLALVFFGDAMRAEAQQTPTPRRERGNSSAQSPTNPRANEGTAARDPAGSDSPSPSPTLTPRADATSPAAPLEEEGIMDTLLAWLRPALIALAVLGGLLFIAYLVSLLVKTKEAGVTTQRLVAGVVKRQDELNKQFVAALAPLTKEIKDLNARLRDMQNDLTNLTMSQRAARSRTADEAGRIAPPSFAAFSAAMPEKEDGEDQFPVAADEYLNRVRAQGVVLKPDFANGILVKDPEDRGELVLVRDAMLPGEPPLNYIVPRVTKFQTQQDFYSYYEKYYECRRPATGDVWIVTPAVVDRVDGGWRLREKGELEVK